MEIVRDKGNRVAGYKLVDFQEGLKERHAVVVPKGSILLKIVSLHDGLYVYYEIPSISDEVESHFYAIIAKESFVPEGAEYVDLIDVIVEDEEVENKGMQKVVLFPIYKLKQ